MASNDSINNTANVDQVWDYLRPKIENVYYQQQMSKKLYIEIYLKIHNHCSFVPYGNNSKEKNFLTDSSGAQFLGLDLYNKIKDFLRGYVVDLLKVSFDFLVCLLF